MPILFFPGGMGGVQNSSGNFGGLVGYFSGQKLEIPGRRRGGGAYVKFPPWWGYGYFLELHNLRYRHGLPLMRPAFSGRVDQTRESGGNRAYG